MELADTLAQLKNWDTDLWTSLMKSWARQLGEDEQHQLLDRLLQGELHKHHIREVAETLKKLLREGKLSHSSGLLPKANQVALMAWESIKANEPVSTMEDWYGRAINHPAGMLTEFWMFSLSAWYNERHPRPDAIPEEYLGFMHKVVNDETTTGRLGKSAMARHLSFLTAVDENWVTKYLVPLFDSEDKDNRIAVWEGFLYEMTSPRVEEILEKPFLSTWSGCGRTFPTGDEVPGNISQKVHGTGNPLRRRTFGRVDSEVFQESPSTGSDRIRIEHSGPTPTHGSKASARTMEPLAPQILGEPTEWNTRTAGPFRGQNNVLPGSLSSMTCSQRPSNSPSEQRTYHRISLRQLSSGATKERQRSIPKLRQNS